MKRIKVLVVDDSALARELIAEALSRDPEIEVVGKASDAYSARDKIVLLQPDVLTLDVEMPKMNGVEFLKRLMPQNPLPVVMVSSLTGKASRITLEALEAGAVDFVLKPSALGGGGFGSMIAELRDKIKTAASVDVSSFKSLDFSLSSFKRKLPPSRQSKFVIVIGASTGGTRVVSELLSGFPRDLPGIVVVQHMPPVFTQLFASRLDGISLLSVREAQDGDRIASGEVLIAPGGKQIRIVSDNGYRVCVSDEPKVNGFAPSVDVLFRSVARSVGKYAIGMILTGMGRDGAEGLKEMRLAGARTFGQDEESSVVFGMPKEADAIGAVEKLLPPQKMLSEIKRLLKEMK